MSMLQVQFMQGYNLALLGVTAIVLWRIYQRTGLLTVLANLFWSVSTPLLSGAFFMRIPPGVIRVIVGLLSSTVSTALSVAMLISLVQWASPGTGLGWLLHGTASVSSAEE